MTTLFIILTNFWSRMSGKKCTSRAVRFRTALEERNNESSVEEACKKAGISRASYFRWQRMLKEYCQGREGEKSLDWAFDNLDDALAPRSKKPKKLARKISNNKRKRVLEEARSGSHSSGLSVANSLRAQGIAISTKKVISVLREEGVYSDLKKGKL